MYTIGGIKMRSKTIWVISILMILVTACGSTSGASPTPTPRVDIGADNMRRTAAIEDSGYDMVLYDFIVNCGAFDNGCYKGVYFTLEYTLDNEEYRVYGTTEMEEFSEEKVYDGVVQFLVPSDSRVRGMTMTVNGKDY
jgi:hypothetical protein